MLPFSDWYPFVFGAPGEIRTPDRLVRSQVLYPTELRAHTIHTLRICFLGFVAFAHLASVM